MWRGAEPDEGERQEREERKIALASSDTDKILPGHLEVWTTTGVLLCACARSFLNASL